MFAPDVSIMTWVTEHRTRWATWFASLLMSAGGSVLVMGALVLAALVFVVVRRRWAPAVVVGSAVVIAVAATDVLKALIGRERPPAPLALVHADGFSMPSTDGGLTAAAALALLLATSWPSRNVRRTAGTVLCSGSCSSAPAWCTWAPTGPPTSWPAGRSAPRPRGPATALVGG